MDYEPQLNNVNLGGIKLNLDMGNNDHPLILLVGNDKWRWKQRIK